MGRIGKAILAAAAMPLFVSGAAQASPETTESVPLPAPLDEVLIDRDRYERMTVPVSIGGRGPFRFLVDTGAQASVVTPRVRDEAELVFEGPANLVAMGSSAIVETFSLDGLEFAGREQNGLTAALLQARHIGADGILGLDALQHMRILLDFREDRIEVFDIDEGSNLRGYEIVVRARRKLGQMVIANARIDGIRTSVVIDTGAQGSFGNDALRRKLRARGSLVAPSTDVLGVTTLNDVAIAREMKIGTLTITDLPIAYGRSPAFESLELDSQPALILGMRDLRMFDRIAIDFAKRRVLFDLPAGSRTRWHATRIDTPPAF